MNDKSFKNKPEERRYKRLSANVLKLKHVLINDPENSHFYILKFLKSYFEIDEIKEFSDEMLKSFINSVVLFKDIDPNLSMRDFIVIALSSKMQRADSPNEALGKSKFSQSEKNKNSNRFKI